MTEYFQELSDNRQQSKVKHNLVETILLVVCAVIAGCDVWEDIGDFCRVKEKWFREHIGLKLEGGIPSHDTMERIFKMLEPDEFERCFARWTQEVVGRKSGEVISIDGKTLRGSGSGERQAIHMVSAWANEARAVFAQVSTEEKSNEITAVPELLELLDIRGAVVTADAMSCQKEIVKKIIEKEADYVIGLKDNQPTLRKDAEEYYRMVMEEPQFHEPLQKAESREKGHGRIEQRTYYLTTDRALLDLYPAWSSLNGIGMMKSRVTVGEQTVEETHYYITSLTDVEMFRKAARCHWGIENSLHYCLDVTFGEDRSRKRIDHSAENFAVVRHIAINAMKQMNDKLSMARRRRRCSYDDAYLEKVLALIHA